MISKPKLDDRKEQHYVGIRTQVTPKQFKVIIPKFLNELFGWQAQRRVLPAGAPFMRYYVIDMEGDMDVEIGVPVAKAIKGDEHVKAGVLPAGCYLSLVYSGVTGYKGNKALVEWAVKN